MATFADSFAQRESLRPFDDDDSYAGYYSQPFDDSLATGDDVFRVASSDTRSVLTSRERRVWWIGGSGFAVAVGDGG
ncbi:hypothetical protein OIU74_021903 [Salix koriyanagi]|uniref:Uncharacterized protein n=1 Tax=Salix koriyanagi TaxID=2511006 RepID=A0A9Q0WJP3_9ROSI|nr:hypothetical protein OIU74_021903 [Salix koriyanagi]